jgi:hypothetical protein
VADLNNIQLVPVQDPPYDVGPRTIEFGFFRVAYVAEVFIPPEPTPPIVDGLIPAAGTNVSVSRVLQFDVTDTEGFTRIIVKAQKVGVLLDEVVHDGTQFGAMYQNASNTRTPITDGYRYTILRDGGWVVGGPTLTVYATDTRGAEAVAPNAWNCNGDSTPPVLYSVQVVDGTVLNVIYSEPVVVSEALVAANYAITGSGGLNVLSVERVSDTTYRVTTTLQSPGASYTLTVSNVHDLNGNLI